MARIPDEALEHLKSTVSVQRLVKAKGVVLTRHGADLHGRLSVPRRPHAVAGGVAKQEPMALLRLNFQVQHPEPDRVLHLKVEPKLSSIEFRR